MTTVVDLRVERRTRGLLLKDVAEQVGVSVSMMSMIESGERRPSPPVARRIAELYGHAITDVWPDFGEVTA